MVKLLKVELKKIFRKKSIYIIWLLMLIFCLLNNILYKTDYDADGNYKFLEQADLDEEESHLVDELKKYNKDNKSEVVMYITTKTKLDILNLKRKFSSDSWQYKKANDYLYDISYKINYYEYVEYDERQLISLKNEYENILKNLSDDNYKYFLDIERKQLIYIQEELKEQYNNELDEKRKQELVRLIEDNRFELKILNYRFDKNIKEGNSYLNVALDNYKENYKTVKYFDNLKRKKTYQEELNYQEAVTNVEISKYIIENEQNINKQNNLNYQLRTIIDDYEVFIVILILIVCSIIICDEFKDGTIKLLLIKPYSRVKILLSKYFTSIIVIFISILLLIFVQMIIGGIIFGVDSLEIPIVVYDFNSSNLAFYNIFQYMVIRIVIKIPFLLILITISLFLGVLLNSTIISITMPLMLYMFSSTMVYLADYYQLKFMRFFVNINWNLEDYLFGRLPKISFINFRFSIILLVVYFFVLGLFMMIIFKKKNIKNI